jgi:hypothetical protein
MDKTHGYFLQMGGFMLMDRDEKKGVLTTHMFCELLQEGKIAFPSITEAEIEDRSKGDSLARGIVVCKLHGSSPSALVKVCRDRSQLNSN